MFQQLCSWMSSGSCACLCPGAHDASHVIRHPGLPALVDAFRTKDGIVQIVMELMEGPNICAYVAGSHQFYESEARKVFRDITGVLQPTAQRGRHLPIQHEHCCARSSILLG